MRSYDATHAQTQTAFPQPLAATGLWNVGALAVPAAMLSICSAVVFGVVALSLRMGAGHELFLLKFPGTSVIAAIAAALAWGIAWTCRRRPGRLWPRVWALVLAIVNSAITLLGLVLHDRPSVLALAVAGLAAAATLAPRFVKLRPDSPMVQWVAPVTVLMILLVILPTSCAVRKTVTAKTQQRVEQRIQQLRLWTIQVNEVTGFDWRRMEESGDAAARTVAGLQTLSFQKHVDDPEVWRSAAILGKDAELAAAMRALTAAVVAGLAPQRAPRVSDLREAAVRWNVQEKRWESYSRFAALSDVTGSYYHELGRLFGELASQDQSGANAAVVDYQSHYAEQRGVLKDHLDTTANTWADNWATFRVPAVDQLIGRKRAPLHDVLRAPFVQSEAATLAAGQLWQLTSTPLYRVKEMAQGSPGCEGGPPASAANAPDDQPRSAPGCQCQGFEEKGREYFRLDCYSYAPREEGTGAELRVEMRLVYGSADRKSLDNRSVPAEIFFHFLLPAGADGAAFREEVMTELSSAALEFTRGGTIRKKDRGGSVAGGFVLAMGGSSLHVYPPDFVPLTGLTPERQALRVRAERTYNDRRELSGG